MVFKSVCHLKSNSNIKIEKKKKISAAHKPTWPSFKKKGARKKKNRAGPARALAINTRSIDRSISGSYVGSLFRFLYNFFPSSLILQNSIESLQHQHESCSSCQDLSIPTSFTSFHPLCTEIFAWQSGRSAKGNLRSTRARFFKSKFVWWKGRSNHPLQL